MAEDETPAADEAEAPKPADAGNRVPQARFNAEVAKRKETEDALTAAQAKLDEIESQNQSELEKITKAHEKLTKDLAARDEQINTLTKAQQRSDRANLVRQAATAANIIDPDVAVAMLDLDVIEDAAAAAEAVTAFATAKPHLVKQPDDPKQDPKLHQVFPSGEGDKKPDAPTDPWNQKPVTDPFTVENAMRTGGVLPPVGAA